MRKVPYSDAGVPIPVKQKPSRRPREHFDWAARYQVGGEEVADIALAINGVRVINRVITQLLEEIGLTRRPPARIGRPRLNSK
jgi:hypothetical protein